MVSPRLRRALRPMKPIVALFRDTAYFRKMHALLGRETSYAPLPTGVHKQLVDYYARDVEALGRMIGRDLSTWLADDRSRLEGGADRAGREGQHPSNCAKSEPAEGFN